MMTKFNWPILASFVGLMAVLVKCPEISFGSDRTEAAAPDTDGDGLPDFHEIHKYRTDPKKNQTAADGVSDGDRQQRREFAYSVRAVLRVMPPYNIQAMCDDYQDVRVL